MSDALATPETELEYGNLKSVRTTWKLGVSVVPRKFGEVGHDRGLYKLAEVPRWNLGYFKSGYDRESRALWVLSLMERRI